MESSLRLGSERICFENGNLISMISNKSSNLEGMAPTQWESTRHRGRVKFHFEVNGIHRGNFGMFQAVFSLKWQHVYCICGGKSKASEVTAAAAVWHLFRAVTCSHRVAPILSLYQKNTRLVTSTFWGNNDTLVSTFIIAHAGFPARCRVQHVNGAAPTTASPMKYNCSSVFVFFSSRWMFD